MNYFEYEELENATIIPGNNQVFEDPDNSVIYNSEKELVLSSVRFSGGPFPMAYMKPKKIHEGSAIYINPWFNTFGHFMLENLSRIWLAQQFPDIPILVPTNIAQKKNTIDSWQRAILDVLHIKNKILFITEPLTVEKLYVPFPLARFSGYCTPEFFKSLAVFEGNGVVKNKKIYLSRSNFTHSRGYSNQLEIEKYLKSQGYTIIKPEEIPIKKLLEELSSAEKILAIEGSALFNAALIKNLQAEIEIIPRHFDIQLIWLTKGLHGKYLTIKREKLDDLPSARANYNLEIDDFKDALANKQYESLEKYSFSHSQIVCGLDRQKALNALRFPFFDDAQRAFHTDNKEARDMLIQSAQKSFEEYMQKGLDYHAEYTKDIVPLEKITSTFSRYLDGIEKKTIIQKVRFYRLTFCFYRIMKEITCGKTRAKYIKRYNALRLL